MELIDKSKLLEGLKKLKQNLSASPIVVIEDVESLVESLEMKEVGLENSMVCKVDWYDGFLLDYTQEQQDELLEKIGADVGDKIRVILIKE